MSLLGVADGATVAPPSGTDAPYGTAARGTWLAVVVNVATVVVFSLPAVALFAHAWDGHLASTLTCECGDTGQAVWFMAWPAYALRHGLDPLIAHVVQVPGGVNLLDNTSSLPVGVVFAPLTWAAGPVVSTNVALTLSPGLSAWAAWTACRHLVTWRPAALAAGLLFGYSPFVVTNLATGHISLCLLVAPPLLVLAAHRILVGPAHARLRWGAAAGLLVAFQLLVSPEILAITVVVGVPAFVVALAWARLSAAELRGVARSVALALVVALVLGSFPLWVAMRGPGHIVGAPWAATILDANPLQSLWSAGDYRAPATTLLELGGYEGALGPPSGYLGPVVLAVVAGSLALAWRRRSAWVLALAGALATVLSLGAVLTVHTGDVSAVWLPWRTVGTWPLLDDVIPQRFSALVDLAVALGVGLGLDALYVTLTRRRRHRTAPPRRTAAHPALVVGLLASAAALVSFWWTYQVPFATRTVSIPRWYQQVAPTLPQGSVVLAYPFPFPSDGVSAPMTGQALDGMHYDLAGGYVKAPGPNGHALSTTPTLPPYGTLARLSARAPGSLPRVSAASIAAVRRAVAAWGVDVVVVTDEGRDPRLAVTLFERALGRPPKVEDGAWVWALDRAPTRAPAPSARQRAGRVS